MDTFEIAGALTALTASLISALVAFVTKKTYDKADEEKEYVEIKKAIDGIEIKHVDNDNVLELMLRNVRELKEYYVISKDQARKSFSAALLICFLGFFIYMFGIAAVVFFKRDISVISIIGGTVVEIIAGLFFWLYKEAINQLSIYHQRLGSTEKYLTVIQVIKEMPEEKRTESFQNLIDAILNDNREIISHEK